MKRAYYLYRPHPHYDGLYPDKVLNVISDSKTICKYCAKPTLLHKYMPDGVGPHGLSMLSNWAMSEPQVSEPITELTFELVRQIHFSDAPSRLLSLYAAETLGGAMQWDRTLRRNLGNKPGQVPESLWEIEYETEAGCYDAKWLDVPPDKGFSMLDQLECAHNYWRGIHTLNPLFELLIPFPVVVVRKIKDLPDSP